jgi:NitT/TauT family transport system ATP-binding protein
MATFLLVHGAWFGGWIWKRTTPLLRTEMGRAFVGADILHSEDLFRQQALVRVPLVATIYQTLQQEEDGTMRNSFFMDILDEYYPDAEAERQFATAVVWGR